MTSEAVTMSKPASRRGALAVPPRPEMICRRPRSSMSITLRQVMPSGVRPSTVPSRAQFSVSAPRRLCAEATAWASPVKWTLISSRGSITALPPPVPPPLMPKMGPSDGSRRLTHTLLPSLPRPSVSPTAVVVLPSPAWVGVMPVTRIILPLEPLSRMKSSGSLAL